MSDEPKKPREAVRLVFDASEEVPPPTPDVVKGAARAIPPTGGGPRMAHALPEGCPITPLGMKDAVFYYLDALRQLRAVPGRDHSRLGVQTLFCDKNYLLEEFWPRQTQDKETQEWRTTGWKPERAAEALMAAAGAKGVWNPFERVRGAGAWRGEHGELVLHCGDVIYDGEKWHQPGLIGRHVYPACEPGMRPTAQGRAIKDVGKRLLGALESWNWRRKDLDALLLLGWIGAAMIGGALDWRPVAWISGSRGTGKSTLHKVMQRLFDGGMIAVSDATAASLWQTLAQSSRPVVFDELEAEEDNRRANNVVKLARMAASGGLVLRGGSDHTASEFKAQSCFLFSSILIPPLLGQDRSRIAVLELDELRDEPPPDLSPETLREMGVQLMRRLVNGWPRFSDTLITYRAALAEVGHSARGADVFGTLLTCADLLLYDHATDHDSAAGLAERLTATQLAETEDDARDEERFLQHLMTLMIPLDGPAKNTVAEWIDRAARSSFDYEGDEASKTLARYGMKIDHSRNILAIANYHAGLARLLDGTHWGGRSGTMGVWVQAVRRLPHAERSKIAMWFAGATCKATEIPLDLVYCPPPKPARADTQKPLG